MNLFDMLGVGNKLDSIDPSSLPIDPLCASDSIGDDVRCFAVAERLFSFTGEDFDIYECFAAMVELQSSVQMIATIPLGYDKKYGATISRKVLPNKRDD